MPGISELRLALEQFNLNFPRPNMGALELQGPYDISIDFCTAYPNAYLPGVYIIFHRNGSILRIGKASCNNTITSRLSCYFKWGTLDSEGLHKHPGYEEARIVYTIGIPKDRAFEAPAVEEYLIGQLNPPYNINGSNTIAHTLRMAT